MAEKTKSTQEELPLHEVVLKLMFEFNKEKPAELSSTDVFWKLSDPSISQVQITQVLNWLVNEKRLVQFAGKYSLDRFELLEQRSRDNALTNPNSGASKANKEEIPLHETVLQIMFDVNHEIPSELTANDVYWKCSDPSVSEANIVEVLNWLVAQRKVDLLRGKYSLDRFEFVERKNAEKSKKESPKQQEHPEQLVQPDQLVKPAPKAVKKEPQKQNPPKPKMPPKPKAQVEEKVVPKVKVKPKAKVEPEVLPAEPIKPKKRWDKFNTTLAVVAGVIVIYMVYLFSVAMSNPDTPTDVSSVQADITRMEEQYDKLTEAQISRDQKIEVLERKLELLKEIVQKRSDQVSIYNQEFSTKPDRSSVVLRLIVSNLLLIIVLGAAVSRRI